MSLLESFADGGALLTIATTHHGELKSLKYRHVLNIVKMQNFSGQHVSPFMCLIQGEN